MFRLRGAAIAVVAVVHSALLTFAAEPVGRAVEIRTAVSGARGAIAVRDPVYKNERISTSKSGLGQFVFEDGTKLAVGWGSSVVIDKFVYDDKKSVKKLTIMAAKGTFRWISGKSGHSAYEIVTPAGTIGVRGTAFDFFVGPDGTTAVVLLSGAADFCGPGGCRQLTQRCDCVVAKPGRRATEPKRVSRTTLKSLGNAQALPFLSGGQRLSGAIGWVGGGCGLRAAKFDDTDRSKPMRSAPAVREKQRQEKPRQENPPREEKPREEKPREEQPRDPGPRPENPSDPGPRSNNSGDPGPRSGDGGDRPSRDKGAQRDHGESRD
ncbi:FecR family protein [Ensifer adhaerens]|uniref:FecR domain-containing protein n=1 Tax=Ensifer adhaerens TaxID=106592 RepID=A0A9Q9DDK6_ENSAD|nr:FecR domain-containing protein [Ensifer adhaerens]USJ27401.1 FecR domain-containing protein [Ensifer adhaerens]UTV41011.1 FecR domain-containing protein [Ensifer adhaerens]